MLTTDALRTVLRDWRIVVGLAFTYLWSWLLYWGGPFSLRAQSMELANTRWAGHVVLCAVAIGVIALCAHRGAFGRRLAGGMRVAGLAACVAGTLLAMWLALDPPGSMGAFLGLAFASGCLTGVGEGCLLCLLCTITSSFGMRNALSCNLVGMAAGGLLFLLCYAVPGGLGLAIGLLCPVVGFVCSLPMGRAGYDGAFSGSGTATSRRLQPERRRPGLLADRSFLMLAAISLVFGFSNGFVLASFEVIPKDMYWNASYGVVIGTILASALAFVAAFVLKMDAWQLAFQTALPLMGAAYLLYPYDAFALVGPGIHTFGYQYFFITFWSLLGSKQVRRDAPAVYSVSLGLFATQAGAALGLACWNVLCAGIDPARLRALSSVAALLLLVAAVAFERPRFGWGNVHPGQAAVAEASSGPTFDRVLERMRADYGLSPRETDVAALLGRGRNRQFVADELGISLETAKTHTTNVYRKLGVHSHQELLDVIEMTGDTLAREGSSADER